jgi:tetratricopeptide (TPR) repeat protein
MSVQQLYDKGIELKDQEKYSEAIAYFDQVIAKEPSHQDAWSYKAYCHLQLENNENVLTSADKALSLDPQDKWTWTNKGMALENLGRYSEAITCYDKAIAIDANYKYPWNNKGWVLEELGRYSEAIRCYEKALEIDPNYSTSQNNLNRIKTKMATSAPPTTTRPASTEDLILDVWTLNAVKNNPSYLPKLSLSRTVTVTKVLTYHWNDGKGATPGSITILDNDQKAVGTWKAKGEPGMYDVPNANWVATPNIDLQAGTYYIKDTSPSTWSWNENTNGQGMTKVWGIKK